MLQSGDDPATATTWLEHVTDHDYARDTGTNDHGGRT